MCYAEPVRICASERYSSTILGPNEINVNTNTQVTSVMRILLIKIGLRRGLSNN